MITRILAVAAAGALVWGFIQTGKVSDLKNQIAGMERDQAYAVAAAHRENARELTRLVEANQEIQSDYNAAVAALDDFRAVSSARDRLRDKDRADIVAAAQRIAGACGRYAEGAERDLEITEGERRAFGLEAAAASATAHSLKRTLDERRKALDARRQALTTKE